MKDVILDTLATMIKNMKCDRYVIINGVIIGANVSLKKKGYDNIESISYIDSDMGINLANQYSFSATQYKDLATALSNKDEIKMDYDQIFNHSFDNIAIAGNRKLLNKYLDARSMISQMPPIYTIDDIKTLEEFNSVNNGKAKDGCTMINLNNVIVSLYKGQLPMLKADSVSLDIYELPALSNRMYMLNFKIDKRKFVINKLFKCINPYIYI